MATTAEQISAFLRLAPKVCETYIRQPAPILSPLFQSDSNEVIVVSNPRSFQQSLPLPDIRAPLRVFRMCMSPRLVKFAHGDPGFNLSGEKAWLDALLPRIRQRLEVLFLPAESTRLSLLAEAPWPHLRELVLYGICPPISDSSLLRVLDMMPNLHAFTFIAALGYRQPKVLIWPASATEDPDIARLRRFAVSSPSALDRVYARLPAALEELSLRDSPRFYERSRDDTTHYIFDAVYAPGVPKCVEVLAIFKTLRCASLVHLELVVIEDDRELDLLSYIADACPRLAYLEFHCYRDASEYGDLVNKPLLVSPDALAHALSAFSALRNVRLNIDTPWEQYTLSPYYYETIHRDEVGPSNMALIIAEAMPRLDTVSVLTRDNMRLPVWMVWKVHDRAGAVDVERLEVTRPGDAYKTMDY